MATSDPIYLRGVRSRTNWDAFFLNMAVSISSRSKDNGTRVGAVLSDSRNRVVSMGYNGPPAGIRDDDSISRDEKLRRTIHAEENVKLGLLKNTNAQQGSEKNLKFSISESPKAKKIDGERLQKHKI